MKKKLTEVTILGEPSNKKKINPIEFKTCLQQSGLRWDGVSDSQSPENWENIVLLHRLYHNDMDLMWAYESGHFALFLGHFNDGIV